MGATVYAYVLLVEGRTSHVLHNLPSRLTPNPIFGLIYIPSCVYLRGHDCNEHHMYYDDSNEYTSFQYFCLF